MNGRRVRRVLRPDVNPVYQPPPIPKSPTTKRRWRWPKLTPWLLILGLVAGFWWFIFRISHIEVINSQRPAEVESRVKQAISNPFWYQHLFWLPPQAIADGLVRDNPQLLASVSIRKDWLKRSIIVEVEDRHAVIRWGTNNQEFGIDQRGIVTARLVGGEGTDLPLVIDSSNLDIIPGTAVAPSQFVGFVRQLEAQLEAKIGLKLDRGRVVETTNELLADTSAGYYLRLDTSRSADDQLDSLKSLLDRGVKPAEYIDLRLAHKIYYR